MYCTHKRQKKNNSIQWSIKKSFYGLKFKKLYSVLCEWLSNSIDHSQLKRKQTNKQTNQPTSKNPLNIAL